MSLWSRIVVSSKKHSEPFFLICRRLSGSTRFLSSNCTKLGRSNPSLYLSTERLMMGNPEGLKFFKNYGSSRRFYSSGTRFTSSTTTHLSLDEQAVTPTSWIYFLIPSSVLAGIGGLLLFIHYNDERRVVQKGMGEKVERSAIQGPIIGGPFTLVDTNGHVVTEQDLLGNWVLFYFGYTSSPDIGPAEVQKMANTINILESKQNIKVLPIFVTIDPQRDTPSQLRAYIREFDSRIVGLTGPVAAIRQMAQEYRVYFRKVDQEGDDYLVESSHIMYLMSPNMEVAGSFGVEYSANELAEAITKEMQKTKIKCLKIDVS